MTQFKRLLATASLFAAISLSATPFALDTNHSSVGFSVKHLMITNVKGNFKEYNGEIDFDLSSKSFNTFKGVIKTASIDTGIEKRDNHLRSDDFFLADKYPEITFVMKKYTANGDEGLMVGDMTIRGVTKEVEMEVEDLGVIKDLAGNNRVGFTLKGKINRTEYGLTYNKALEFGGVTVGEDVKITVEIQAIEQ